MASSAVVRRSFFLHHTVFGVFFVGALFFATFLLSGEYQSSISTIDTPLPPKFTADHAVTSTESFVGDSEPRVSVIIDDVGENLPLLNDLLQLSFPVTVSVLPGAPFDRESAMWAKEHGLEVMVHLPMEPEEFPEKDPGSNALFAFMNRRQLVEQTSALLAEIPHAAGVNNHMGSLLTSRPEKMNVVLNVIAREGLFFVDSRTSAATVGYKLAQRKRMPAAERTLFLDNPGDLLPVRARFEQLVARARQDGQAIGICHLKPETLSELSRVDIARYQDVRFTFASELVARH